MHESFTDIMKSFIDGILPKRYWKHNPTFITKKGMPAYRFVIDRYDLRVTMISQRVNLNYVECVILEHDSYLLAYDREWPDWNETGSKRLSGRSRFYASGDTDLFISHAMMQHFIDIDSDAGKR
jgi:hypothetical protein